MVHQIHKLLEQLKLIPGQNMEVQKLLFSFIGWNSMHLVWFPYISCMEFRPPWSDFHTLAWKSDSSIPAWCGSGRSTSGRLSFLHFYLVGGLPTTWRRWGCHFSCPSTSHIQKSCQIGMNLFLARLNIDKSLSFCNQVNAGGKETLSHARHRDWITSLTEGS